MLASRAPCPGSCGAWPAQAAWISWIFCAVSVAMQHHPSCSLLREQLWLRVTAPRGTPAEAWRQEAGRRQGETKLFPLQVYLAVGRVSPSSLCAVGACFPCASTVGPQTHQEDGKGTAAPRTARAFLGVWLQEIGGDSCLCI